MTQIELNIGEDILAQLNEIYLDSRYPLTLGHLPKGFPSVDEANAFYEFAEKIHNQISYYLETKS